VCFAAFFCRAEEEGAAGFTGCPRLSVLSQLFVVKEQGHKGLSHVPFGVEGKHTNRAANAFRMGAQTLANSNTALGGFYRRIRSRLRSPKASLRPG
jgi:hypothetical protein